MLQGPMSEPSQRHTGAPLEILLAGTAETRRLARDLAERARPGDIIGLAGPLGCGKTTFARAFIRALAGATTEVPSPTFTLLQVYAGRDGPIHHFDLYRIESPEDAWELGIEEAFGDGIALIEWPERLGDLWPADALVLTFAQPPGSAADMRRARLVGGPSWSDRLAALREKAAMVAGG